MEQPEEKTPMPDKSCMITVMFAIKTDQEALAVKQKIDDALKDIKDKRYSFGINER